MSNFGPASFRPSPGLPPRRLGRHERLHMDEKARSSRSSPHQSDMQPYPDHDDDEEQFVMSVAGTPVTEETPKIGACRKTNVTTFWASFDSKDSQDSQNSQETVDELYAPVIDTTIANPDTSMERSQPIAIEMPTKRMGGNQKTPTPTAPLSARGDLPGGYFPDHEDRKRVHRTHPFHADIREARRKSIARAGADCSPDHVDCSHSYGQTLTKPSSVTAGPGFQPSGPGSSGLISAMATSSYSASVDSNGSSPSISSYNPTGAEDNLLPMGKYYPTNWEARKKAKRAKQAVVPDQAREPSPGGYFPKQPAPSSCPSSTATSSSALPKPENPLVSRAKAPQLKGHSRSDSEAKRRLQQYQRDMITQTSLGAHRVLGSQIQKRGADEVLQTINQLPALRGLRLPPRSRGENQSASSPLSTNAPAGSYLTAVQYNMLPKPVSPRLQPLGSPGGPMTPMDLSSASEDKALGATGRPRMPASITTAPARDRRQQSQGSFPFEQ